MMDRPLHADDLVAKSSDDKLLAVVERAHGDVDTHEPYPGRTEPEKITHDKAINKKSFNKFMTDGVPPKGTVMVRWHHKPSAELIPESKLKLVDRSLLLGDVVKRNVQDAMSGVVINTFTKCTLQPMCDLSINTGNGIVSMKGLLPPGGEAHDIRLPSRSRPTPLVDVPAMELECTESPSEEDLVIYKDHLGRIDVITNVITLRLSDNGVVEINDDQAEHADGGIDTFFVGDIATTKKGNLRNGRWIFGRYNANTAPYGTVVATRTIAAEVTWLQRRIGSPESGREPPMVLERDVLESSDFKTYDRTRPSRSSRASSETISNSEIDVQLGRRVRFRDLAGACVKYDKLQRIERTETLGYDINVFDVVGFQTEVTVQWQDLSISKESSINLVPDTAIDDEHAAWPGEIAHTLDVQPVAGMPGITQPGKVGVVQGVNAAERMANLRWCPSACLQYCENAGDAEVTGSKMLLRGIVGEAGQEQQEVSLYDVEAPGQMNVRRGDIVLLADNLLNRSDAGETDWLGEIVDTCLDGTLVVRLGAASEVRDLKLNREAVHVAVRSDGTDQMDGWGDDSTTELDGMLGESEEDDESDSEFESEDASEDEEMEASYEDENGVPLDEDDVEGADWESDELDEGDQDVEMADAPDTSRRKDDSTDPGPPEPYLVLDSSAPSSHHFVTEPSTENTTHMKRMQKEHKILRSANSLPHGVYVRTWESRLDLLRVLFIGPAETPYADAPFIIDFYLPSSFPNDPPKAFFHSWVGESGLGGVGRVNPNLYEDGKICLSLLGTWEGSKGEGWSAGRSTLLQVLVSLLGLVLVREPYFNEAGYEPLAGLESSRRPSALYNESTFLRARTFVIKTVAWLNSEHGTVGTSLDGVEDVVRWLYKDEEGKKLLEKSIEGVRTVLERSEQGGEEPDGLNVVSKGACIPLRRVLDRLRQL